jgi:hypothetical protein
MVRNAPRVFPESGNEDSENEADRSRRDWAVHIQLRFVPTKAKNSGTLPGAPEENLTLQSERLQLISKFSTFKLFVLIYCTVDRSNRLSHCHFE